MASVLSEHKVPSQGLKVSGLYLEASLTTGFRVRRPGEYFRTTTVRGGGVS